MLFRKNHRHTGMDLRDELIRLACDNRASAQPIGPVGGQEMSDARAAHC